MTSAYKTGIYAPVRKTFASVAFDLAPADAKKHASVDFPPENLFSQGSQLINNVENISCAFATLEPDYWRLDGSFALPAEPAASECEVGWWGSAMSGGDGVLHPPPVISAAFSQIQSIAAFGAAFDELGGEVIAELEFRAYDSGRNLIFKEKITGNTSVFVETDGGASGVAFVELELLRTGNPFRYPRVTELLFGRRLRFSGDDIIRLNSVSETDFTGKTLPSPALVVEIRNGGRFSHLDGGSLAAYLNERQVLEYRHGLTLPGGGSEWVNCGVFYLSDWSVADDRVTFEATGLTAGLDAVSADGEGFGLGFECLSAGAAAERLFEAAGVEAKIAPELFSSPPVCAHFGEGSLRKALAQLAELCSCACWEDRRNVFHLAPLNAEPSDSLDYSNMFSPPKVKQAKYCNALIIREYTEENDGRLSSAERLFRTPWHDPFESDYAVKIDLPMFVRNKNPDYNAFLDWFLERKFALLRRRLTCDVRWRQNPAQETGSGLTVQTGADGRILPAAAYYEALDFDGGVLKGNTKLLLQ